MAIAYQYDASGYFAGEVDDYGLLPNNATYIKPPSIQVGKWPCWNNNTDSWDQIEDHRKRDDYDPLIATFGADYPQEATEYWMPEDNHYSQPRVMDTIGPLPGDHMLTPPPLVVELHDKISEIQQPFLDEQDNLRKMLVTAQLSDNKDLEEETKLKYQESIRDMNIETSKLFGV